MNLTAAVLTKNEESNISDCIRSIKFCDEIIIIDDNSDDKTVEIAEKLGAKVFKRRLNENYADQRNFALQKAKGKWVLFVDADERVPKSLADEIIQLVSNPLTKYSGFYIERKDILWGKKLKHGETGNIKLRRLAKKGSGKWKRRVHEYWDIKGMTYMLKNAFEHYPHQTLNDFVGNLNRRTDLHAKANYEERKRSNIIKIIVWPTGHFINNFILKKGFLDGIEGTVVALMMSFHSYLAWSKLWLMQKK